MLILNWILCMRIWFYLLRKSNEIIIIALIQYLVFRCALAIGVKALQFTEENVMNSTYNRTKWEYCVLIDTTRNCLKHMYASGTSGFKSLKADKKHSINIYAKHLYSIHFVCIYSTPDFSISKTSTSLINMHCKIYLCITFAMMYVL